MDTTMSTELPPSRPQSADEIFIYLRRQTSLFHGDKISPQQIASAIAACESGDILEVAEIMSIMVHDGDILAPFVKRIVGINSLPWSIEPASTTKTDRRNADNIKSIFESLIDVPTLLLDLSYAILTGVSILEIADRERDDEGASGWIRQSNVGRNRAPIFYPKFVWRPLHWFVLNNNNKHEIRLRDNKSNQGQRLAQFMWVTHRHPLISGYIGETGVLRQILMVYAKKHYADDDWSELLEILGVPPRIGKFPPGTSQEDKQILRRAVKDLGHCASGIMPETMKIELLESASLSGNQFADKIEMAIRTIERLILGASTDDIAKLTSVEGQRLVNLATIQRNQWDCHFLQETIRHQILYPMNGYNNHEWDPLRTPKFVFDPRPIGEFAANADGLLKLVHTGMRIPKKWAHEFFNIPLATEDDDILEIKTTARPATQKTESTETNLELKNGDNDDDSDDDDESEREKATALKQNFGDEDDIELVANKKSRTMWKPIMSPIGDMINRKSSYNELENIFDEILTNQDLSQVTQDLAFYSFVEIMAGQLGIEQS